jgi:hypothetical protein
MLEIVLSYRKVRRPVERQPLTLVAASAASIFTIRNSIYVRVPRIYSESNILAQRLARKEGVL